MKCYQSHQQRPGQRPQRPQRPGDARIPDWDANRVTAEQIAAALGGHRNGNQWTACCPSHDDRKPSLSIGEADDGTILVFCHAGCSQAEVIAALSNKGLWPRRCTTGSTFTPPARVPRPFVRDQDRIRRAMSIWEEARTAEGSIVEDYLHSRGLALPPAAHIRYHPRLYHQSGSSHPAMIALVTDCITANPIAVHRTYLSSAGKKADVPDAKMILGPCAGGVARLGPDVGPLLIGEGIETTLSGMRAVDLSGWAALSASGLSRVRLPPALNEVIFLADGDKTGRLAANCAAARLTHSGVLVRQADAPDKRDFNDLLLGEICSSDANL